jgi:hypothetical protein
VSDAEPEAPDSPSLRMQLRDLEDFARSFLKDRLERLRSDHEDLEARVAELEGELEDLQAWRENVTGVADDHESTPEKRVLDLREAMIRQARESDADGVTWWWQQVEENLTSLGHAGFSKPTYYETMEAAAAADGFEATTKTVAVQRGNRTETMDVEAVRVNLPELPASGRLADRKQVTTVGSEGEDAETTETANEMP